MRGEQRSSGPRAQGYRRLRRLHLKQGPYRLYDMWAAVFVLTICHVTACPYLTVQALNNRLGSRVWDLRALFLKACTVGTKTPSTQFLSTWALGVLGEREVWYNWGFCSTEGRVILKCLDFLSE